MNKMFFKIGLGLLALAGVVWPSRGAVTGMKTLHGHVPAAVAHLAKTGDVASTNKLHLAIGVQLRNEAALDDLVNQVGDPSSPNYQHYLSRDEFVQHFAPTEAEYQSVIDFAQSQGLTVLKTNSNRMLVEVEGRASDVQKAFKVSLHNYNHPTENRSFFAPDSEPMVPESLPIADISGLNNYARPHNHLHTLTRITNSATAHVSNGAKLGSGPIGTYMGNDFRAAYVPGAPQTGTGQKVALVQFDGYLARDIQQYESMNGLPNVALTNILLNGFSGFPTFNGGEIEVSLDIEMVISMAPGVSQVMLYEGDPFNFFPNVVLNQIAVDDAAPQVSCSWGWQGGPNTTSDQIFKEMILQGQTFYDASGDQDAFLPGEVDNPGLNGFPSDDPFITQVGATTLSTTGPGGALISETVWNYTSLGEDGIGSSGGISSFYGIPSWQTNAPIIAAGGSTTFRNFPDVACVGDNVLVIADGGVLLDEAGTSCAAPLWAGFTALVNQQAGTAHHAAVGFINPTLYALGASQFYTNVFNDVTTGSNAWSQSPTLFYAKTNYDLCTGLGSMAGINLINALTSVTNLGAAASIIGLIPAPTQPWGNTLSVMNGADPNGLWLLYFQDDTKNNLSGTNYNGWYVSLTTANPVGLAGDDQLYVNTTINSTAYGNATNVLAPPGSSWHTVLAVTNYGPSLSSNVLVTETLPVAPGVTIVSSNTALGSITNFGGAMVWNVGNLAVNSGGTLTLNLQVNSAGIYTNTATVNSLTTDPNPDDDTILVIANSNPTTPPMITPLLSGGGSHGFQLTITNDPGANIVIQGSTNLLTWVPICTNVSPFTFTNYDTTNFLQRFYRALVQQ